MTDMQLRQDIIDELEFDPSFNGECRLLIFSMLLVAAGWEIFRLILTAITLD